MKIEQLKKIQEIWDRRQNLVEIIQGLKERMESAFESECDFDLQLTDKVEGSNSCGSTPHLMIFDTSLLEKRMSEMFDGTRYAQPGCSGTPAKTKTNHKTKINGLSNMEGMMVFQLLIDFKTEELKGIEKELIANGLDLKP